jgi:hypothetical protein
MKRKIMISKFNLISGILLVLTFIVLSSGNSFSVQDTIRIRPYADNTLYEDASGSYSNSLGQHFFSGATISGSKRRGLIRFNLFDYIPPCATVISVSLKLHMSKTISGNQTIELRKVSQNWGQGSSEAFGEEGYGAPAEIDDPTWIHTFYDQQFWVRAGGDFSNVSSSAIQVGAVGYYTWGSTSQMVNDVQSWVLDPSNNFGWLLLGNESSSGTTKRFDTGENDSINFRPLLTVVYIPSNSIGLNVTSVIEGFWDGTDMISDTVKAYLRGTVSPYAKIDSAKTFLNSSGNGTLCFGNANTGSYYVVASHRNSIDTWSKFPVSLFSGGLSSYDFSSDATQAFGDNEVYKLGLFCIYSGDVNKDGFVDITDSQLIDNDSYNFVTGYVDTDVNGDDFVDVSDATIADNNSYNFVSEIAP